MGRGRKSSAPAAAFLTIHEVAELLGISRSRAYQVVRSHEVPSVQLAGRVLVPRAAWNAWLRERGEEALATVGAARGSGR